jgi:iron complex transport system substrate-binding protein
MIKKGIQFCFLLLFIVFILGASSPQLKVKAKDDRGKWIILERAPQRIISLAPNLTEILYFLELEEKVVAVSTMCNYPPEVAAMPRVGGFNPSVEKIISLQPDLILATTAGNRRESIRQLELLGQSVFVTSAKNIEDIFQSIIKIGSITGKKELAVLKTKELRERMKRITSRVKGLPRRRILYLIWHQPVMTAGGNTFIDNLIWLAGGKSISRDIKQNIVQLSREEIIKRDPEMIFLPDLKDKKLAEQFMQKWEMLTAVRNGAVYQVNEDLILRPGPRIVDGLKLMVKTIHPEAFTEK